MGGSYSTTDVDTDYKIHNHSKVDAREVHHNEHMMAEADPVDTDTVVAPAATTTTTTTHHMLPL